jgi:hypothetical protein
MNVKEMLIVVSIIMVAFSGLSTFIHYKKNNRREARYWFWQAMYALLVIVSMIAM